MPCCRHNSAVASPASPCFKIAMICSSLCRVPFICVSPSWVWRNSHSTWHTFRVLDQLDGSTFRYIYFDRAQAELFLTRYLKAGKRGFELRDVQEAREVL